MKEVNVDLLVIGDVLCESSVKCLRFSGIACAGNAKDISADHIPDSVILCGVKYVLSDAIVMVTNGKSLNIDSLITPDDKSVFASGNITSL